MKYRTKYQSRIHFLLFRFYSYSAYRCAINCNYIYASLHFCNIIEEWKKTQTKFIEKKVELDSICRRCIRLNKLMHCIISRLSNQRILEITHAHTFMPHQILSLRTLALCNKKKTNFHHNVATIGKWYHLHNLFFCLYKLSYGVRICALLRSLQCGLQCVSKNHNFYWILFSL